MKKLLLVLFTLLAFFGLRAQTVKLSNPIYIFNILLSCQDEAAMHDICAYYELEALDEEDGFNRYSHSDGTIVKFKMKETNFNKTVPLVQVLTPLKKKEIDSYLTEMGYRKGCKRYVKGPKQSISKSVCCVKKDKGSNSYKITSTKKYAQNSEY